MLKTIDILLGITVVMLVVSMCVTMLTQAVIRLRETRGKKLLTGLSDLLQQIDPSIERRLAEDVANAILRHPLVNDGSRRLGATIHREEFTTLLLELGSGNVPEVSRADVTAPVSEAIRKILADHGVVDPAQTLEKVRAAALHIERANPEIASDVRQALALMQEVQEKLVGKVHAWFDGTIDRVSARFTADARQITVVSSFVVAFALQLDLVGLVNRLSVDPALRQALVERAATASGAEGVDSLATLTGQSREELQDLVRIGALTLPGAEWITNWGVDTICGVECPSRVNILGVLLSALLLSLGAPFWYNILKNLVRLRSVVASKDDEQRQTRQTSQVPSVPVAAAAVVAATPPPPAS